MVTNDFSAPGFRNRLYSLYQFSAAYRYFIASVLLILAMFFHTLYGNWVHDFWEHSAGQMWRPFLMPMRISQTSWL